MKDRFQEEMKKALDRQIKAIEERQGYPIPAPAVDWEISFSKAIKEFARPVFTSSPAVNPEVCFVDGPLHGQRKALPQNERAFLITMPFVEAPAFSSYVPFDEKNYYPPNYQIRKAKYQRMITPMADGSMAYFYMGGV